MLLSGLLILKQKYILFSQRLSDTTANEDKYGKDVQRRLHSFAALSSSDVNLLAYL